MLCYWVMLRLFDLNPTPYHWLAWLLHSVNVALVYAILRHLTGSFTGAASAAMLFAFHSDFRDIYWSFGTIFELTAGSLFFAGILIWIRAHNPAIKIFVAAAVYLTAIKAKEMAVTLPAVWLIYELLIRGSPLATAIRQTAAAAAPGVWLAFSKFNGMRGISPEHPYYMDWSGLTFGSGYGWYFNRLFYTDIHWQKWIIGSLALALLLAL